MKCLYSDRELYLRMSTEAKKTIRNRFSPEICGARMRERLEKVWACDQKIIKSWRKKNGELNRIRELVRDLSSSEEEYLGTCKMIMKEINDYALLCDVITGLGRTQKLNDEQFISILYCELLNRECRDDELNLWKEAMKSGESRKSIIMCFLQSDEYQSLK